MKWYPLVAATLAAALLSPTASAQSREAFKAELVAKEEAAKDVAALMELARWAEEKGLSTDHKRLLNKVIELEPDHAEAREVLGYVQHDGTWMLAAKRDLMVRRELEKEMKAKGLTEVQGVWVPESEVEDARRGVFWHEGQIVTASEKLALADGKVRHPITGEFIAAEHLEKANQALYPTGDDWVEWSEADEYHASWSRPWVWRTEHATIITTVSIQYFEQIKFHVDDAILAAQPFFGGASAHPAHRPTIMVCATVPQYQDVSNAVGDGTSIYGACLAVQTPEVPVSFNGPPALANWGEQQPWGTYYLRHAAGLAYARAMARGAETQIPAWLITGVGSLVERHSSPDVAKFFGQQHLVSGGIKGLESWGLAGVSDWIAGFRISPELAQDRLAHNIYQAGLLVSFAMHAGDQDADAAATAFADSFQQGGDAVRTAAEQLATVLGSKESELSSYLKNIIEHG